MEIKVNTGARFKFTRTIDGTIRVKVPESSTALERSIWYAICTQIGTMLLGMGDEFTLRGATKDVESAFTLRTGSKKTNQIKYKVRHNPLALEVYDGTT